VQFTETLLTVAELAVALAGFSSLASAAIDVANVIGLGGAHAFSLYLASLLLGLGCTGLVFLSVAVEIFRAEAR
jgi:hypothetical protein